MSPNKPSKSDHSPRPNGFRRFLRNQDPAAIKALVRDVALAMAGSLAISLAFPDMDWWPLAWFGPALLLASFWKRPLKQVFWIAMAGGTLTNLVGFFWMNYLLTVFGHLPAWVSLPVVVLGAAWQALSIAGTYTASLYVTRKTNVSIVWTLPIFYTAFEYVHPILFPWFLGNSQYKVLWLTQICDLVGVPGITFMVAMGAATLFALYRRIWAKEELSAQTWAFPALLLAVLGYGVIRLNQVEEAQSRADSLKLAVLEPEIGIFEEQRLQFPAGDNPIQILRWNLLRHQMDTSKMALQDVDLVLWPESSYFPVISSLAHRGEPDGWLFSGRDLVGAEFGGSMRPASSLPGPIGAIVSAGEHRTWVAGSSGGIWRLTGQGAEPLGELGAGGAMTAGALPCSASEGMEGTSWQSCVPVFVGRGGKVVRVVGEEVEILPQATNRDLLSVAAFSADRFVVAGEEVALLISVPEGTSINLDLPPKRWLFASKVQERIVLVSSDGFVAEVSEAGQAIVHREEELRRHDIVGAASLDGQSLMIATGTGLLQIGSDAKEWVASGLDIESMSCDGSGECILVSSDGRLRFLEGQQLSAPQGLPHAGPWVATSVPFTRYLWWIPDDSRRIYQAKVPLPADGPYPGTVLADLDTPVRDLNAPQRGFRTPLLFGAIAGQLQVPDDPHSLANTKLNSAFLVDQTGNVLGRYDKQYLLAFGEYLPGGATFPWLYDLIPESGRFTQGPNQGVLHFLGHKLGVLICYEDLLTHHTRGVVEQGAEILLNLTNDAWFGKTKEPDQHFVLATFRAIEYRKTLVRATCTGISGVVLPSGRIVQRTGLFGAEQFIQSTPLMQGTTLFSSGGYLFPWLLLAVGMLLVLVARRRQQI